VFEPPLPQIANTCEFELGLVRAIGFLGESDKPCAILILRKRTTVWPGSKSRQLIKQKSHRCIYHFYRRHNREITTAQYYQAYLFVWIKCN